MLQEKFASARRKVSEYLAPFGIPQLAVRVEIDEKLDALAPTPQRITSTATWVPLARVGGWQQITRGQSWEKQQDKD